jgi:hypothetical protein
MKGVIVECPHLQMNVCVVLKGDTCDNLCKYFATQSAKILELFYVENFNDSIDKMAKYFKALFDPSPFQSLSQT